LVPWREGDQQPLPDRILHAAFGAFLEHGYTGTSTLEIATRAKVSKRELYALFSSKEAMLAEGIRRRTEQMQVAPDLAEARDRKMLSEVLAGSARGFCRR
jgi:AcrR family transcriptional regulator